MVNAIVGFLCSLLVSMVAMTLLMVRVTVENRPKSRKPSLFNLRPRCRQLILPDWRLSTAALSWRHIDGAQ